MTQPLKTREELLREIRRRMEASNTFFPDIWDRILQTETPVLREIANSEFEREVFAQDRPSKHL